MKRHGFGHHGSRMSISVLPTLALGLCVAIGCSGASNDPSNSSSNKTKNGGQSCSGEGDDFVSSGGGDVQLRICTGGTGGGETGGCTPGTEGCPSGGGKGGSGGGCTPGTEGCPSGNGGSSGCTPGTEGCPSTGEGGSGGDTGCTPGTEGCPSTGEGGSGGGGSGGSGGPCTLTQGYWKNHPEAWPVTSLSIGGVAYSQADLLAIFGMDPGGDASLILADQLIAALLNQATGVTTPPAVAQAIADSQAWMAANMDADGRLPYGTPPGSDAANAATAIGSALDSFNNGLAGVAHCN